MHECFLSISVPIYVHININIVSDVDLSINNDVNATMFDWPAEQVRRISLDDKAKVKAYSIENDKAGWLQKNIFKKASCCPSLSSPRPAPPRGHGKTSRVRAVISS